MVEPSIVPLEEVMWWSIRNLLRTTDCMLELISSRLLGIILLAKSSFVYILMTTSSWFLVTSWIISPFLFNPSGFDWLKTVKDFDDFIAWLWSRGGLFTKSDQSWYTWWNEEQEHLKTTGVWGKLLEIILNLRFFFQYSIVYHLRIADEHRSIGVYMFFWACIIGISTIYIITIYAQKRFSVKEHIKYRFIQFLVCLNGSCGHADAGVHQTYSCGFIDKSHGFCSYGLGIDFHSSSTETVSVLNSGLGHSNLCCSPLRPLLWFDSYGSSCITFMVAWSSEYANKNLVQ